MREIIQFKAEHNGKIYEVETVVPKRKDHKGYYKMHGYILRRVKNHPFANKRGYVPEHRLIMERHLGRFLNPRKELVHHIDGNRSNNELTNLKLTTPEEHFYEEHFKARNPNGQFVAEEPIFGEIKFRLYDCDKNIIQIYTLKELISKTFRRAKFKFRGRFTGLYDKHQKPIYEGDIVEVKSIFSNKNERYVVEYSEYSEWVIGMFLLSKLFQSCEVIGNICENPELIN